jgi:hypothetical protein
LTFTETVFGGWIFSREEGDADEEVVNKCIRQRRENLKPVYVRGPKPRPFPRGVISLILSRYVIKKWLHIFLFFNSEARYAAKNK